MTAEIPALISEPGRPAGSGYLDRLVGDFLDVRLQDCMELMAEYQSNHFDLAIVDPPYGIGEDGEKNHSRSRHAKAQEYAAKSWDRGTPPMEYFEELRRVSKHQIIWGANHFMEKIMRGSPSWIVWDKLNGENDFADCELAYTSHDKAVRICRYMWAGHMQGKSVGSMEQQGNKALNEKRIHPTQKPVRLYNWLLKNYTAPGMKVLDTHLGSGSHAIACHYARLHLTACEIDADYFAAACARIKRETAQESFDFPNVASDLSRPSATTENHQRPDGRD